jgi:rubrerythrin
MSFQRKAVRRPGRVRDAQRIDDMIRVDHAGEYGAVRIYKGQLAVFGDQPSKSRIAGQLQRMEADEQHHLNAFDDHIRAGLARPTLLGPIWDAAGFALGADGPPMPAPRRWRPSLRAITAPRSSSCASWARPGWPTSSRSSRPRKSITSISP